VPSNKSEKLKLYIVIGLILVAAIVAYFRFAHKKNASDGNIAASPPQDVKFDVSQIQKTKPKRLRETGLPVNESLSMNIRDIFTPVQLPTESKLLTPVETSPAPIGVLELKGTIIGGKEPMAVINDKFVRMGEKIGEYQIVKIDPNEVVLRSSSQEKVLQIIAPADNQ
jgi:hypothetical protein